MTQNKDSHGGLLISGRKACSECPTRGTGLGWTKGRFGPICPGCAQAKAERRAAKLAGQLATQAAV